MGLTVDIAVHDLNGVSHGRRQSINRHHDHVRLNALPPGWPSRCIASPPLRSCTTGATFHEFASDWFGAKHLEIRENTTNDYRNDLTNYLLPFFKDHRLSQITVAEVDRYRQQKVRGAAGIAAAAESGTPLMVSYVDRRGRRYRRGARPLSARSINMHIDLLAQILAVAVDHGYLPTNPATR